eukprot:CAMPEP_0167753020 /NCGR_PEP_ID=MMETSP0110_2-20121227/7474_1 /TAXON_ID=629695 /ORGANISM="Gymnochlora sp., Strain CCMP2014" /LENGTH=69 /DNA_ID=CAMNT_0007638725 /DNA_START=678 /DNA_END=888 /DNA_ORIENTATION=-
MTSVAEPLDKNFDRNVAEALYDPEEVEFGVEVRNCLDFYSSFHSASSWDAAAEPELDYASFSKDNVKIY